MLNRILTLILLSVGTSVTAQLPEFDYFPPALCKTLGLREITVYEIKVDSGKTFSAHGNDIHVANNVVRKIGFDTDGNRTRIQQLGRGGKIAEQDLHFEYNANGLKRRERLLFFHTNNADSTRLLQQRITDYHYDSGKHLISKVTSLATDGRADTRAATDSIAYTYDPAGKLISERVFDLADRSSQLLEKTYRYAPAKIVVQTNFGGVIGNRDEYELDNKGRKSLSLNFGPGDTIPRLETRFIYDARDRLTEMRYLPNWAFFQAAETEVLRKNKFDNHGKLLESQITFGDGRQLLEFYDAVKPGDDD